MVGLNNYLEHYKTISLDAWDAWEDFVEFELGSDSFVWELAVQLLLSVNLELPDEVDEVVWL